MRWTIVKCIMFLSFAGYVQGIILPWAISNNRMPVWADILLVALILVMWVLAMERVATKLISKFKDDKDASTEQSTN